MPISYSIDHVQRVMLEQWTGEVSESELAAYWQRLLQDPVALDIRRTVVDLRECTILFSGQRFSALIESIVMPALNGRDWKTAIVVEDPVNFGISRQYSAFADRYSNDAIFSDPGSAVRWLLYSIP